MKIDVEEETIDVSEELAKELVVVRLTLLDGKSSALIMSAASSACQQFLSCVEVCCSQRTFSATA